MRRGAHDLEVTSRSRLRPSGPLLALALWTLAASAGCGGEPDQGGGGGIGWSGAYEKVISIADALKKCLVGRCDVKKADADKKGKMPPYNYGWGYICDQQRSNVFWECIYADMVACQKKRDAAPEADRQKVFDECMKTPRETCLPKADKAREDCKDQKNTCNVVRDLCVLYACRDDSDRYECWQESAKGKTRCFGYTRYKDGKFEFVKLWCQSSDDDGKSWKWDEKAQPGQDVDWVEDDKKVKRRRVPEKVWAAECEGRRERCEKGLKAAAGDKVPPIEPAFCSAACYGHNCHHAAAQVCQCIKDAAGELADVSVVVLDEGCDGCPPQPGNISHSVIAVNHPKDKDKRCLVESQVACGDTGGVDERCCFKKGDLDDYKKLHSRGCPITIRGPLGTEMKPFPYTKYTCENFLDERGTRPAEEPKTEQAKLDARAQPCAVACTEAGLAEVVGDQFMQCPEGWVCSAPGAVECGSCGPEACGASCDPLEETPIVRGTCVPLDPPPPDGGPPLLEDLMSLPPEDARAIVAPASDAACLLDASEDQVQDAAEPVPDAALSAPEDAAMCVDDVAIRVLDVEVKGLPGM